MLKIYVLAMQENDYNTFAENLIASTELSRIEVYMKEKYDLEVNAESMLHTAVSKVFDFGKRFDFWLDELDVLSKWGIMKILVYGIVKFKIFNEYKYITFIHFGDSQAEIEFEQKRIILKDFPEAYDIVVMSSFASDNFIKAMIEEFQKE